MRRWQITSPEQCQTMEDVDAFEAYLEADSAKHRLQHTLASLPWVEANGRRTWWGLGRVVYLTSRWRYEPAAPIGYRALKLWDRGAVVVLPLWLFPFYAFRQQWQRWIFAPLCRLGLWVVDEGDYYVNGQWAWHQPFGGL